jgi:hypothetical protein
MTTADRVIKWTTAVAVVGVAAVASHEHAYALVRAHGEAGWTARLVPLTRRSTSISRLLKPPGLAPRGLGLGSRRMNLGYCQRV